MLNFYDYHNGDLDNQDIYDYPISRMHAIRLGNPHEDYSDITHIIKKIPEYAYHYAKNVLKGRWIEAEPYIIKNPQWASNYSVDIIKGRWPEAEPVIMKTSRTAYWYALCVIKGRWIEAEPIIKQNSKRWYTYCKEFGI